MSKHVQGGRTKHTPIRTCIACRQTQGKRSLIRLVRTAEGVCVDPTGKLAGRGAYVHNERACWEVAIKGGRLEQALRTRLGADMRAALVEAFERMAEEQTI